jgi:hypothetical protein
MPPISSSSIPPPGPAAFFLGSGFVAIRASVVRSRPATLTAFVSAVFVTLAGSTMPSSSMSPYSPRRASKPHEAFFSRSTRWATTVPSKPAFCAICCSGRASASRRMSRPIA